MNRPTDFAALVGLSILGLASAILAITAGIIGLATSSSVAYIIAVPFIGLTGLCAFRLSQQNRRERREEP